MYPRVPDLPHLLAVQSVARTGSMSQSARELGIPQQTISARIARSEQLLGLTLFIRTPSGVRPTRRGNQVISAMMPLISASTRFADYVAELRNVGFDGAFPVAVSHTIAESYFPTWAAEFRRQRPGVRIQMTQANSSRVRDLVHASEVRLGLVEDARPSPEDESSDPVEVVLGTDQLVLVAPRDHPWADGDSVTAEELRTTPLVLREPGSGTRKVVEEVLGCVPVSAGEFGSLAAMRSAIVSLGAPGIIAREAVIDKVEAGELSIVETPGIRFDRRLVALFPPAPAPGLPADSAAEALMSIAMNDMARRAPDDRAARGKRTSVR